MRSLILISLFGMVAATAFASDHNLQDVTQDQSESSQTEFQNWFNSMHFKAPAGWDDYRYESILDAFKKYNGIENQTKCSLSNDEIVAIYIYTQSMYELANPELRFTGPHKYSIFISTLNGALAKLPNFSGDVYRAVDMTVSTDAGEYIPGKEIVEKGYTSASFGSVLDRRKDDHIIFTIHSKHGKKINLLSSRPTEREVLFSPGAKFNVIKKTNDKITGQIFIELSEE